MQDGFSYTGVLPPPRRGYDYVFLPPFFLDKYTYELYRNVDGAFSVERVK